MGKGEKIAFGAELEVDYFNFLFQAEYIYGYGKNLKGQAGGGCGGGGTPDIQGELERDGYYAMLLYKTPWGLEPVVKYEYFNPNLKSDYNLASDQPTEPMNAWTFGINYFINDWSRLQVNYIIHSDDNVVTDGTNNMNNSLYVDHDDYFQYEEEKQNRHDDFDGCIELRREPPAGDVPGEHGEQHKRRNYDDISG